VKKGPQAVRLGTLFSVPPGQAVRLDVDFTDIGFRAIQ